MTTTVNAQEGGRLLQSIACASFDPKITIVTVVYNGRNLLVKTIESVRALNRQDVAFIVVDGASKDGTVDLLRECGNQIDYWISEPDSGIYNAMNKAVKFAAADSFILFLGAGDTILNLPDAGALAEASNDGTQMLYGDVRIGDMLFRSEFSGKLQYRNTLHHQGLFLLKSAMPELWFDESIKVFSDWDLNLRLFEQGTRSRRLNFTVAYAEPDGVSAKLHLSEIAGMISRRCGLIHSLAAVVYHGGLHLIRRYARIPNSSRE